VSCSLLVGTSGLADPPTSDAAPVDAPSGIDGPSAPDAGDEAGKISYRSVVLEDAPLGYYRLGDRTGGAARDETGRANGAYGATCALGAGGALREDTDTAVGFDNCAVVLGQHYDFGARSPFSVEAWVNASVVDGAYRTIAAKESFGAPRHGWSMWSHDRSFGFERFRNGSGVYAEGKPLAVGKFTHAVATYDGSTLRMYLDGVQVAGEPDEEPFDPAAQEALIGASNPDGTDGFRGVLDEIAFYDKALTADRIRVHFDAGRR
jgi:hypothetical protein